MISLMGCYIGLVPHINFRLTSSSWMYSNLSYQITPQMTFCQFLAYICAVMKSSLGSQFNWPSPSFHNTLSESEPDGLLSSDAFWTISWYAIYLPHLLHGTFIPYQIVRPLQFKAAFYPSEKRTFSTEAHAIRHHWHVPKAMSIFL